MEHGITFFFFFFFPPPHIVRITPESGRVALISGRLRCAITGREQSQQDPRLFDHLVGADEQGRRDGDAERLGGLEVQKQFRFTSPRDARAPNAL